MKLPTGSEMQAIDRAAIEKYGIPGLILMENAGLKAVLAIGELFGDVRGLRVHVVAGKGNNGGDAFVVARHLVNLGARVFVTLTAPVREYRGDAAVNLEILNKMRVPVNVLEDEITLEETLTLSMSADLTVDGIFGTGLSGKITGLIYRLIDGLNSSAKRILSIDIPSGISATTGEILGTAIRAELTVTMGLPKIGLLLHPGAEYAGKIFVADISLPVDLLEDPDIKSNLTTREFVRSSLFLKRKENTHKGDFGHVITIAGSESMTGAGLLAAEAALRTGAGLSTLIVPEETHLSVAARTLEIMAAPASTGGKGYFNHNSMKHIKELLPKASVLAIGPGVGRRSETARLVARIIEKAVVPVVLDADGLLALKEGIDKHTPLVATPHPGELANLLEVDVMEIQKDRPGYARMAARKFNAVLVLKGSRTIIAAPDGEIFINPTGNPGMATAGSGDVLTGIIAGLIAQKHDPFIASIAGVYIHGLAGDIASRELSELSLMASSILETLPEAICEINRGDGTDF